MPRDYALFRDLVLKKYPAMAAVPVYNTANFALRLSDSIPKRGITISNVQFATQILEDMKVAFDVNYNCAISGINLMPVEAAAQQRDSSGSSDEDDTERVVSLRDRERVATAIRTDVEHLFALVVDPVSRIKHGRNLVGALGFSIKFWNNFLNPGR